MNGPLLGPAWLGQKQRNEASMRQHGFAWTSSGSLCCVAHGHIAAQEAAGPLGDLRGHVIICGAEGSFVNFVEQLRRCDPMPTPVVVLHPRRPSTSWSALKALGPIHYVAGTVLWLGVHGTSSQAYL